MRHINHKYKIKPSYDLYVQLRYTLDIYLKMRIDVYIFFLYYESDLSLNLANLYTLKKIYEYDYLVFKTLLFLYWDLEYYLEGLDYVKNTLNVNSNNKVFLRIQFNNRMKTSGEHIQKIKGKKSNFFWAELEIYGMFDKILEYDLYGLDYVERLQEYLFNNDAIVCNEMDILRIIFHFVNKKKITALYYESFINNWYNEWYLELNVKHSIKYKKKILNLHYLNNVTKR
jgi:hypothetical protein